MRHFAMADLAEDRNGELCVLAFDGKICELVAAAP